MKLLIKRMRWLAYLATLLFLFSNGQRAFAQSAAISNPSFEEPYSGGLAQNWSPWHEERNTDVDCNTDSMFRRPSWSPEIAGGVGGQLLLDGIRSQHVGNQFATWRGGVFQNVSGTTAGTQYRFTASAWGRASQEQYPAPSDRAVDFTVRVGIDPTGGGNWTSTNIIWGPTITPHDTWLPVSVEAAAQGSTISVFIDANFAGPGHCRSHLDVWFDAASIETTGSSPTAVPTATSGSGGGVPVATDTPGSGGGVPVATNTPGSGGGGGGLPVATNTPNRPRPTNTPNWAATNAAATRNAPTPNWQATNDMLTRNAPTETPIPPTETPVPVQPTTAPVVVQPTTAPVVVQPTAVQPTDEPPTEELPTEAPPTDVPTNTPAPEGGTICVNTFADDNANGQRDASEGYMAGIPVFIGQNGVVINQGATTGSTTAVCFEQLTAGEYEVAQRLPGSLEMTTAGSLTIPIEDGQQIGLEFGSRVREIAIETPVEEVAELPTVVVQDTTDEVAGESGQPTTTTQRNGLDTLSIAGIVILGVAVVLLGGILVALLRR